MSHADPTPPGGHDEEQAAIARWVATWQRAGVELEEHRRTRLATMTLQDMRRAIEALFAHPVARPPRASSGLVEMQRLLSRLS